MEETGSAANRISGNGVVKKNQGLGFSSGGTKIENPFAFKALQVFTGFGVGCGIGIGSGAPLNLGTLPMVGEVMSAARGATNAFSGLTRQLNDVLWKLGARNIRAGVGCGVGFGHGFGVGVAVKPSAMHKLQASLLDAASSLTTKLGLKNQTTKGNQIAEGQASGVPSGQNKYFNTNPPDSSASEPPALGTRTEKVINSFLENPILKQQETPTDERLTRQLKSEKLVLEMVLRHQKLIEELMEENERLRRIVVEDLKVPPDNKHTSPCSDCFECLRKQRRKR
ncbi:PREDICTED: uncharacterized protein LOC104798356 [Tarenaya hassleriana]|uniref:uncharacterized protein LOC104798356 n=1 Tax=Tarenaya hassleriana TaxID=28532 RepID=UPI00053C0A35|nr:PREDICTED: uncharacterized protein LOC104798356 [Tarenaya hassleriana]